MIDFLKKILKLFEKTPLHPQWLVLKERDRGFKFFAVTALGNTLDIGSGNGGIEKYLQGVSYFPLDYPDSSKRGYTGKAVIYGDAHSLPIKTQSLDTVLLMDVAEHLKHPDSCLSEINRALKDKGVLCLSVPYLYPTHDQPADYQRWTQFGILKLADEHDFQVETIQHLGNTLSTACLLFNIGIGECSLKVMQHNKIAGIFIILFGLPVMICSNLAGMFFQSLPLSESIGSVGFNAVLRKNF